MWDKRAGLYGTAIKHDTLRWGAGSGRRGTLEKKTDSVSRQVSLIVKNERVEIQKMCVI